MKSSVKKLLGELGFSENERNTYLALTKLGEATASVIAKKAELPRTTVISILEKLEKMEYISMHRYRGKYTYWVESPQLIQDTFEKRVVIAKELKELLGELYHSEADFPFAKVYDTKSAIKTFIEKLLRGMSKNEVILTIDNPKSGNYQKILSEEFYYQMLEMKNKKGIVTRTLIPNGAGSDIDPNKIKSQSIILREMPNEIEFSASFWIIGDALVLFSGKYPFVISVNHKLITNSMRSIFEFLWKSSLELKEVMK